MKPSPNSTRQGCLAKIFWAAASTSCSRRSRARAYICGEETALLASIEGQRPEVRTRPPFPTQQGLFRKPTIVNNVETFSNIHAILTLGGAEYAKTGTPQSTGPKLL